MPVSYHFDSNIIVVNFSGTYTIDAMKAEITRSLDDPGCPDDAIMLLDLRDDESVQERSPKDIREMSYFFGEIRDRIHRRMAMVTSDTLSFGLMNMAKAYDQSMGIDCRVFNDMDKALDWMSSKEET